MTRDENIEIFKDTEKQIRTNPLIIQAWKNSSANQKLYLENDKIPCEKNRFENPAKIVVSKKRTFEAAGNYKNKKVAVLNFASASNPGGGVVNGSFAQEESLCRCSTLYYNLTEDYMWTNFYQPHRRQGNPIHNDDLIYTPEVVIFKSDTESPELLPEEKWQKVNVITCAAPNLRDASSNPYNIFDGNKSIQISDNILQEIHEKRARKILDAAVANENEVVILGAFGCGAFRNKPEVVAAAYKTVLKDYEKAFEVIEFAVYCSKRDESNYLVFNQVFEEFQY